MNEMLAAIEDAMFVGVSVADQAALRRTLRSAWEHGHSKVETP